MTAMPNEHTTVNLAASENNEPEKATPENQAFAKVISTSRSLGLLDLPPELRLMIYRHLLIAHIGLWLNNWSEIPRPPVDILRTSKLIYREAVDVFLAENRFMDCCHPRLFPTALGPFPRVIDTIRNLQVDVNVWDGRSTHERAKYSNLIHHFGKSSIIGGTLVIEFSLRGVDIGPLKFFIRALRRFTNFRTVKLDFDDDHGNDLFHLLAWVKATLESALGYAEDLDVEDDKWATRAGLRFHPMNHRNLRRGRKDGDWADFLDGIRLEWNENKAS